MVQLHLTVRKMAENTAYLESTASAEILENVAWKKEILKAKKLFEATAQVPSPSKDFTQIIITEKGVVWRRWKITLRGISQGAAPAPSETAMSHEDFKYDSTLQGDIERIFGPEVLRQIQRILSGSTDELSKLPEKVMIGIASYLDLQSVTQLSHVNRHLREVCNSNPLWESLYYTHQGTPNDEVRALAREIGWKKVFFMNKLQLQKELSRRRRIHSPHGHSHSTNGGSEPANSHQSPSSTFLTQSF